MISNVVVSVGRFFDDALEHVGMTGLDSDIRFDEHKVGIHANAYV